MEPDVDGAADDTRWHLWARRLSYSTVSAFPDSECNPYIDEQSTETGWLILSIAVTSLTVGYMAFKADAHANASKAVSGKEQPDDHAASAATDAITVQVQDPHAAHATSSGAPAELKADSYVTYHFVMMLACFYSAMLVTDWGVPAIASEGATHTVGYASAWILMVTNWLCQLLCAPRPPPPPSCRSSLVGRVCCRLTCRARPRCVGQTFGRSLCPSSSRSALSSDNTGAQRDRGQRSRRAHMSSLAVVVTRPMIMRVARGRISAGTSPRL